MNNPENLPKPNYLMYHTLNYFFKKVTNKLYKVKYALSGQSDLTVTRRSILCSCPFSHTIMVKGKAVSMLMTGNFSMINDKSHSCILSI